MSRAPGLVPLALVAAALAAPLHAGAQGTQLIVGTPATQNFPAQVQALAPQLVNFAGSQANFQNLVNGLAQGTLVTLVGLTPDGFEQTVTFTPAAPLGTAQIAQTLEQARQQLITRGIAAPSPAQLGTALVGGSLATPSGTATLQGLLGTAATSNASAGASSASAANGMQIQVRPVSAQAGAVTAVPGAVQARVPAAASPVVSDTGNAPAPTHTSDSPFLGNTSDTPLPQTAAPSAGASGQVTNTSPAARMQNRR